MRRKTCSWDYRVIPRTSDREDIWRELRIVCSSEAATEKILATSHAGRRDAAKQGKQIEACIKQADEYFKAADTVGLPTKPVLLYYGTTSLTRACYLLKLDGTYSLDYQRNRNRHQHHGLDLCNPLPRKQDAADPKSFLDACSCRLHMNGNKAWGHFCLFYKAVRSCPYSVNIRSTQEGQAGVLERRAAFGRAHPPSEKTLLNGSLTASSLLGGMPDLYHLFKSFGIKASIFPGKHWGEEHVLTRGNGSQMVNYTHWLSIDDLGENGIREACERSVAGYAGLTLVRNTGSSLLLKRTRNPRKGTFNQAHVQIEEFFPPVVESMTGDIFSRINDHLFIPEPAAWLAVLFVFGMLARYNPDVWMSVVEQSAKTRELLSCVLRVASNRVPNLVLDQMTDTLNRIQ